MDTSHCSLQGWYQLENIVQTGCCQQSLLVSDTGQTAASVWVLCIGNMASGSKVRLLLKASLVGFSGAVLACLCD